MPMRAGGNGPQGLWLLSRAFEREGVPRRRVRAQGGGDDVIPAGGQVEQGEEVGRLAGGGQHGRRAPLQGAQFEWYRGS